MDFVFTTGFTARGQDFGFDFKIQNILGTDFNEFQSGNDGFVQINQYDQGATLSIGLIAHF